MGCRGCGCGSLPAMGLKQQRPGEIAFPEPAYSAHPHINRIFDATTFRYGYQSLVTPSSVYEYDVATGASTLLKQLEIPGGFDRTLYASERIQATAPDGVEVPVSIVYRRDKREPGKNPLYVYGYGSYGYSLPLGFSSNRLSLLDRGVVMAYAHIRGGGDMGEPWHDAGKMLVKRNTFTDFIACVEYLTAQGYGDPRRVATEGGSAGGLLMGAIANMRPDLFRAIVSHVPFVDVMNTMLDASLPLTVPEYEEWGDPNEEKYFKYMLSYSPYDNLRAASYPAMLVKTSLHDSQVMYWEPAKYVAKLRTLKTDQQSAAAGDEYAGRARRSERAVRLPERDCAGLCVSAARIGSCVTASAPIGGSGVSLQLRQRFLQARRVFHIQRLQCGIDLLEQAAEHLAGTDFDEEIGAGGFQRLHAIDPAHRAGDLANQRVARGVGRGDQVAGHVGGDGNSRIVHREPGKHTRHFFLRGLHERTVEWSADRKHDGAARAFGLAKRRGLLDRRGSARDDGLARRVEIGRLHDQAGFARGLSASLGHLRGIEREHGGHGSLPRRNGLLHGAPASLHGAHRIGKGERARNDVRRPLAQRMPGGERRRNAVLGEDARCRHAHRHDGRLRVLGQAQIFFRPFETEARKREAERRIGLGKGLSGNGKSFGEIAAHANGLRTLPRKEKGDLVGHFSEDCIGPRY